MLNIYKDSRKDNKENCHDKITSLIFYENYLIVRKFWTWCFERQVPSPTWPRWSSACCGPAEDFSPFPAKWSRSWSPSRSRFEGRRTRTRPRWSRRSLGWKTSQTKWRSEWSEALPFPGISDCIDYFIFIYSLKSIITICELSLTAVQCNNNTKILYCVYNLNHTQIEPKSDLKNFSIVGFNFYTVSLETSMTRFGV